MAFQELPGAGIWVPTWERLAIANAYATTLLIDATGEKIAFCGRVQIPGHASKDIQTIGFRFGAVTKAGGSALTVSLQDVDLATGPVIQPDGTQDQTVAIANANAAFVSNTWITTGNLSANRTVQNNELLAVVIEFDGVGRLGADSVIVSAAQATETGVYHQCMTLLNTGSWAAQLSVPDVILGFSDGTFGTLLGSWPSSAMSSISYKSDSTPDEYCLEFQFPFPVKVDGAYALVLPAANTSNFDFVLYDSDGTTGLINALVPVDANAMSSGGRFCTVNYRDQISLLANTVYRLAIKPTQATSNVTIYYTDVANANHFQAFPGGANWRIASRTDLGGTWTATTTRRPMMGLRVSSFDDGTSASSGISRSRVVNA